MKFEMTALEKTLTPYFEIEVEYEHGDSDFHNTVTDVIKSTDLKDLELYIKAFKEMSNDISANRSESKQFPEKYKENIDRWDFYFPVQGLEKLDVSIEWQKDIHCGDEMLAYFADMTIMQVHYFDEKGNKFKVSWTE